MAKRYNESIAELAKVVGDLSMQIDDSNYFESLSIRQKRNLRRDYTNMKSRLDRAVARTTQRESTPLEELPFSSNKTVRFFPQSFVHLCSLGVFPKLNQTYSPGKIYGGLLACADGSLIAI